jgi:14-3-3 protein epsilon
MNPHSFLARIYHTAGLSAKASDEIGQLASIREPLTAEDEATVSVVTKARVDQLRRARRILLAVEEREENKGRTARVAALRQLKDRVEGDIANLLTQYIGGIDGAFLVRPTSEASRVLFLKMKADYLRYLAEIQRAPAQQVQAAYVTAYEAARAGLGAAHPLRTGIALNYSVFHFEIAGSKDAALQIAKAAHDEGVAAVKTVPPDEKEDAMEVLNLIATNIRTWS